MPDLNVNFDRFDKLFQEEQESGLITGAAGLGTMTAALAQVRDNFASLIKTIEDYTARTESAALQINAALIEARKIFRGTEALKEKERRFADEMTKIQDNVIMIQESSVLFGVKRQALGIQDSLTRRKASGSTETLRVRQSDGQRDVMEQLAVIGKSLTEAIEEIESGKLEVPTFRQLSTTAAVLNYWRDHLPGWAAAIGIDLLPLIILLAMIGMVEQQRDIATVYAPGHSFGSSGETRKAMATDSLVSDRDLKREDGQV